MSDLIDWCVNLAPRDGGMLFPIYFFPVDITDVIIIVDFGQPVEYSGLAIKKF